MFNKGIEWKLCEHNPAKGVEHYREDEREFWLTEEQYTGARRGDQLLRARVRRGHQAADPDRREGDGRFSARRGRSST